MPLFSVVIPAYMAGDKIKVTLDSLLCQSFKDFEVVIVDDCSSDYEVLVELVNSYIEKGLIVKISQLPHHINGAGARNEGIRLSSGGYIAFLDSDDEWKSEKLEFFSSIVQSCEFDEKTIFYNKVRIVNSDTGHFKILPTRGVKENESVSEYIFGYGEVIQTSGIVLRKDIALDLMFNEDYKRHQDYDFCIRAFHKGYNFELVDNDLTIYNVDASTTKKESSDYSLYWIEDMKKFMDKKSYHTFKAYVLTYKYVAERRIFKAIESFMSNVIGAGYKIFKFNMLRLLRKIFDKR